MRASLLPALLLAALLAGGGSAAALDVAGSCKDAPGLDYAISPGLAGRARSGRWTPVRVHLTNQGDAVRGRLELLNILADQSVARYEVPVELPARSNKVYFLYYVATGNSGTQLRLEREDGRTLFDRELLVDGVGRDPVIVVLGNRAYGLPPEVLPPDAKDPPRKLYTTVVVPLDAAPDRWLGYDAADEVLLADPLPSDFRSAPCASALVDWVKGGGQAIYCVGDRWQGVPDSVFAPFVPGELTGSAEGDFARLLPTDPLPAGARSAVRAVLRSVRGRVLAGTDAIPMIVEHAVGCGRVYFAAFDPGRPPFAGWAGLQAFWEKYVLQAKTEAFEPTINGQRASYYYYDLGIDIANLVENAPIGNRIGTGWLLLTLGAYLFVLGWGDYWLLRRLRRLDWMWLTMAGWVGLFTAITYGISEYGRERNALERTVRVVDVAPDGFRSGVAVTSLYAPVASSFDVVARLPGFAVSHHQEQSRRGGGGGLLGDIRGRVFEEDGISLKGLRVHRGMMVTLETRWVDGSGPRVRLEATLDGTNLRIRNGTGRTIPPMQVVSKSGKWTTPEIATDRDVIVPLVDGAQKPLAQPSGWYGYEDGEDLMSPQDQAWRIQVLDEVAGFTSAKCFQEAREAESKNQGYVGRFSSELVRDLSRELTEGAYVVLALADVEPREAAITGAPLRSADATVVRLIVRK